ncbi:MAG: hypothetical protein R2864_13330 [Syntrophotaleaceae bacterium]
MFGYACDETAELMPMPITYAHRLTSRMAEVRKSGLLTFAPRQQIPGFHSAHQRQADSCRHVVVVSSQHAPDVAYETLREALIEEVSRK